MDNFKLLLLTFEFTIFIYFIILFVFNLIMMIISLLQLLIHSDRINNEIIDVEENDIPISIIVPAYNEQEVIVQSVNSLLNVDYPNYEIIIVNDGSTDQTITKLIDAYQLVKTQVIYEPYLETQEVRGYYRSNFDSKIIVIDKVNGGGKHDALNTAINFSKNPLFCTIDADSILDRNALRQIVLPFIKDETVKAVAGQVRIGNNNEIIDHQIARIRMSRNFIVIFQILEYLRAFLASRVAWGSMNGLVLISGAFGLYEKKEVLHVGGYDNTLGEDFELTVRLHHHFITNDMKYKIAYAPEANCWTQAPFKLKDLRGQRIRWRIGLIDTLVKHYKTILNPRLGIVGLLSMSNMFFVEFMGTLVEFFGFLCMIVYLLMGYDPSNFLIIFLLAYLFGLINTLSAILLEELTFRNYTFNDIAILVFCAFLEQLGFRQLRVWWRLKALVIYFQKRRGWGHIDRVEFDEAKQGDLK